MGGQAVGSSSAAPCGSACLPMPSWQARAAVDPRLRAEGDGGEEKGSLSIEWARHGKRCFCPSPLHQTVRQETPPFTPSSLFRTARHRRRCFSPSPLSCRENTRPFSPPHEPVPTIPPSRHGYTARRCSEAGSARGGRGRRRTSRTGPAENGLPPATRGKREGVGPALSLMPRTARRACLCGTQGGRRWRMRRHRPPGWTPSGRKPLPSVSPWSAARMQKRKGPCRKPARIIPVPCLCRGTGVAGKNR